VKHVLGDSNALRRRLDAMLLEGAYDVGLHVWTYVKDNF
jgi:hypothetical protein